GEALLTRGSISHNVLQFHQSAIEAWLTQRDGESVEHHVLALEEYTRGEPLPWCDFFVRRGRTLAAVSARDGALGMQAQLLALIDEARTLGLVAALPLLEQAADEVREVGSGG
ncbi:MAG: hypothetical protein WBG92_04055, partial [Thiohalocapsa sp.]